jgi:penicillin-binding protein 1A
MTAAYAAFANGGMRPTPMLIRRVETTEGEVLLTATPRAERAVSEATAFLMTTMMEDVVNGGTGWQARRVGFQLPAAGKTGTTNDYRDAWFVGYTPHLAAGVWVGYDQPRTIIGQGYAATLAVPLWGRFMAEATRNHMPDAFKAPRTVTSATICRISGKLATDACRVAEPIDLDGNPTQGSMVYTEYFLRGSEPADYCLFHTHAPFPAAIAISTPAQVDSPSPTVAANPLPVPIATTGVISAGAADVPSAPQAEEAPAPPRRGFWGRFFRRGGGDAPTNPASAPSEPARTPAR